MAQESKIEFDSHYFKLYKSSTVHTHKKTKPSYLKGLWIGGSIIFVCVALIFALGYTMLSKYRAKQAQHAVQVDQAPGGDTHAVLPVNAVKKKSQQSVEEYTADFKPRVSDVLSSAPRYDQITKPRDFPRPTCISSSDPGLVSTSASRGINTGNYHGQAVSCQCYTQQMSRMKTSIDFCMDVVQNGYFDDSQQQRVIATDNPRGATTLPSGKADGLQRGLAAVDQRPTRNPN